MLRFYVEVNDRPMEGVRVVGCVLARWWEGLSGARWLYRLVDRLIVASCDVLNRFSTSSSLSLDVSSSYAYDVPTTGNTKQTCSCYLVNKKMGDTKNQP